ncbi:MAG TPA: hypothetical protein VFR17_04390, partial [Mycobacterium sp.]|nr:hypothetical protein [Mycobacterium sp.]
VRLRPRVTGTIKLSVLDWEDTIDRTALGFDQLKPPGLAEVAVLGADGRPIASADAERNRARRVTVDCDHGPVIAIAGRFVHTSVSTTVGALLDAVPVGVRVCDTRPIALPPGQQELLISPGEAFVVDSAQLSGPLSGRPAGPDRAADSGVTPAATGAWGAAQREVRVAGRPSARVLVVPESVNPGWVARAGDGTPLAPVVVNGWQQGWVLPAGTSGTVTLTFGPDRLYRAGLAVGLALLPLLTLLAWWPGRRRRDRDAERDQDPPAGPWAPRRVVAAGAGLAVGGAIAGVAGVAVFGAALGLLYLLRHRPRGYTAATLGLTAGGLIAAGAVLSGHPWRSVDGYAGHWAGVQVLALISVAVLTAAAVTRGPREQSCGSAARS